MVYHAEGKKGGRGAESQKLSSSHGSHASNVEVCFEDGSIDEKRSARGKKKIPLGTWITIHS